MSSASVNSQRAEFNPNIAPTPASQRSCSKGVIESISAKVVIPHIHTHTHTHTHTIKTEHTETHTALRSTSKLLPRSCWQKKIGRERMMAWTWLREMNERWKAENEAKEPKYVSNRKQQVWNALLSRAAWTCPPVWWETEGGGTGGRSTWCDWDDCQLWWQ